MKILKNVSLVVVVCFFSFIASPLGGKLYELAFPKTDIGAGYYGLIGMPLVYIFLLTLVFTAWGGTKKYWWIGIGLVPVAIVELYLDPNRIYFPILLGLLGWFIGWGIQKLLACKPSA